MSIVVCVGVLLMPLPASAHHWPGEDAGEIVTISGTLVSIHWSNPHVRLVLRQVGEDGLETSWSAEGAAVNVLERRGLRGDRLSVGDQVEVTGPVSAEKGNSIIAALLRSGSGETIVLAPLIAARAGLAGSVSEPYFPAPDAAQFAEQTAAQIADQAARTPAGNGIFGVWTPRLAGQAPGQDELPLTAAARERRARYDPQTDDPTLACTGPGMPAMLDTALPVRFVRDANADVLRMHYEAWGGERTIYMQPGRGPPAGTVSPQGVSFGRWEGDTLAIFTLYIDHAFMDARGTPLGGDATVLERYTPGPDGRRLDWVVTITDPAMLTESVERAGTMTHAPGESLRPYPCSVLVPSR